MVTNPGVEGHSHWKVVWGCATLKTPFSRPHFSYIDLPFPRDLFKLFSSSRDPHFFKTSSISRPIFVDVDTKFLAPETLILEKFVPETPVSRQKISYGDPIFETLGSTYLPKILLTPPLPGLQTTWDESSIVIYDLNVCDHRECAYIRSKRIFIITDS